MADDNNKKDDNKEKDLGLEIVERAAEGAIMGFAAGGPKAAALGAAGGAVVAIVKHAPSPDSLPEEQLLLYLDDNY